MKPKVFIASSVEGHNVAKAIQVNLEHTMEVTIWNQGIFDLSAYALESLLSALDKHDFGIFVFSPDDKLTMRDTQKSTARDNVIFELGLFVGRLGRNFNFIVKPRNIDLHIPSDLYGITSADFEDSRSDGNLYAALGSASTKIEMQIKALFKIDYPASGHHGENILSELVSHLKHEVPYSFKANLKNNQSLKVKIISTADNACIWHYRIGQTGDWLVDSFDHENKEQLFHLKGASESDLHLTFQKGSKVIIEYYENGDTKPTRSKTL